MSNKVTIEDVNYNNSIQFDFDEKVLYFFRKGWASKSLNLIDIAIPFEKITAIELIAPLFRSGRISVIVEGKRLLAEHKFDNNASEIFVNNNNNMFSTLSKAVFDLRDQYPNIQVITRGHLNVPKSKTQKDYAINTSSDVAPDANKTYRKKCLICGHIFCYTVEDLKRNDQLTRSANAASLGALFGPAILSATNTQSANDQVSRIVDYSKCPKCGSKDITDATDADIERNKVPQGTVIQQTSSADELKKFKELLDMGAITQEEFDAKKKQLLGL